MTANTTALVQQLREALEAAMGDLVEPRATWGLGAVHAASTAIAAADKWLAAPQAVAQPLTDEQIIEIRQQTRFGKIGPWADTLAISRAIQRACADAWGRDAG